MAIVSVSDARSFNSQVNRLNKCVTQTSGLPGCPFNTAPCISLSQGCSLFQHWLSCLEFLILKKLMNLKSFYSDNFFKIPCGIFLVNQPNVCLHCFSLKHSVCVSSRSYKHVGSAICKAFFLMFWGLHMVASLTAFYSALLLFLSQYHYL